MFKRKPLRTRLMAATAFIAAASLAQAADTGYVFVSSEKDNVVTVLDGQSYEVVKQIGTAARPRHLQFSPDRTKIYVAAGDGDAIDIIDVAKLELVDQDRRGRGPGTLRSEHRRISHVHFAGG